MTFFSGFWRKRKPAGPLIPNSRATWRFVTATSSDTSHPVPTQGRLGWFCSSTRPTDGITASIDLPRRPLGAQPSLDRKQFYVLYEDDVVRVDRNLEKSEKVLSLKDSPVQLFEHPECPRPVDRIVALARGGDGEFVHVRTIIPTNSNNAVRVLRLLENLSCDHGQQ